MRRPPAFLLALAVPALLVTACGDDDGSSGERSADEQAYVDAWVVNLTEADEEGALVVDDDDADCMAVAVVDRLGTEVFEDADVTPADVEDGSSPGELLGDDVISEEDARATLDDWTRCTDLDLLLAESTGTGAGLDEDGVRCLADGLQEEEDLAVDLLVASFTTESGDPEPGLLGRFSVLLDECSGDADGTGGALVESLAASFMEDGALTEDQARCLAQHLVDTLGAERLFELSLETGDFEDAPSDAQQEFASALVEATGACEVPLSAVGG